ncbi:protein of unknown function [Salegentibacter echinorum]|uniref:DUF4136 domain-containing protein n=1 Tax=Salegentibacter echinorum TaxID=1073325 RepID=A0A1M5GMD5_SALEC|nr:DUF4136 domain-containing protein [Salegentibacter echinorum]SHG04711.1 protein of unknown function [Salegentibacter echinorum]
MKLIKLLALCLILTSCNAPKAVYDYDSTTNFSTYTTYQLFPDFQSGLSQLDETRLIASLEKKLQQKGISKSKKPDLYINAYSQERVDRNRSSLGIGIGSGGRNVGVGVSGGIPIESNRLILEITIDFINVEKDALIWQAVVETKVNPKASPQERRALFNEIVEKALEGYPPE